MGCHVAVEDSEKKIAAVICLGYPLVVQTNARRAEVSLGIHSFRLFWFFFFFFKGQDGSKRDEVLLQLRVPILFIQGTRDALCPLKDLEEVQKKMTAPNELHVVDTGDHSLQVLKKSVKSQSQVDEEILSVVNSFLQKYVTQSK